MHESVLADELNWEESEEDRKAKYKSSRHSAEISFFTCDFLAHQSALEAWALKGGKPTSVKRCFHL